MRPRRHPIDAGPLYAALVQASDAFAFWCDASHAVLIARTVEGLRRQTTEREPGPALGASGRDPRAVSLTAAQLRGLLDTSWTPIHLVGPDYRVPAALVGAPQRDAAAALHAAGEPLWSAPEGGDTPA